MTDPETAYIDWHYPPPRPGVDGAIDRFIGPGTTPAELILEIIVSLSVALLLILYALARPLEWNLIQLVVGALLALDIAGGVVTNATSSAKRWYHRAGQGAINHLTFLAAHIIHLLLLVVFFRASDWGYAVGTYGYVMLSATIVTFSPLYLRRPIAFTGLMGAFALNAYVLLPTPGFEWFLPAYTLKLLVAHLLREEPYRPLIETGAKATAVISDAAISDAPISKSETSSAPSQLPTTTQTAAVDVMEILRSLNSHQLHELRTILAMHDDENDDTVTLERPRHETD